MPKETFGGDDDEEAAPKEEAKKPNLSRYSTGPDLNIKNIFWQIMDSYSEGKGPGTDLQGLSMDRFAIVRSAISALSRPSPLHSGLDAGHIARYSIMLFLDAGWDDVLVEFLEECRPRLRKAVVDGLEAVSRENEYSGRLVASFRAMLRYRENSEIALVYLGAMQDSRMSGELRKELIILARGDIGQNQLNAIWALSSLDDDDTEKTMLALLSHWDDSARLAAAQVLLSKPSEEAALAARGRLKSETNEEVLDILKKIAGAQ